jgi:DNA-damage-inducible protein J
LPFSIKAPNEASRTAIAEADQIVRRRRPRFANADALLNGLEETSRK